jgi:hypothetical protein
MVAVHRRWPGWSGRSGQKGASCILARSHSHSRSLPSRSHSLLPAQAAAALCRHCQVHRARASCMQRHCLICHAHGSAMPCSTSPIRQLRLSSLGEGPRAITIFVVTTTTIAAAELMLTMARSAHRCSALSFSFGSH